MPNDINNLKVLEELSEVPLVTHIVLSVGGNDIRNALPGIKTPVELNKFINTLQTNYFEIIEEIRKRKPDAQLILMNQYIIDSNPEKDEQYYGIYAKLKQFYPQKNAVQILCDLMKQIYAPIFQKAAELGLPIIDMASSLDHKDSSNYISQIEPSTKASSVIAQLISKVVTDHEPNNGSKFYKMNDLRGCITSSDNIDGQWAPVPFKNIKPNEVKNEPSTNHYFLLKCGVAFSSLVSISSFTVAIIAIAGLISLSMPLIAVAIGTGIGCALATYGLYSTAKELAQNNLDNFIEQTPSLE